MKQKIFNLRSLVEEILIVRGAQIITQYNLLLQLIILRIDELYWEELVTSSALISWGVPNGCLLLVIVGWRNQK